MKWLPRLIVWCMVPVVLVAAESWWEEANPQTAALAEVLDGQAGWVVTDRFGRPADFETGQDGERRFIATPRGLTFTLPADQSQAYEVQAWFRFRPAERSAVVRIDGGIQDPADKDEEHPFLTVHSRAATRLTLAHYHPQADQRGRRARSVQYDLDGIGERSLGWPEELRRRLEHEAAALPAIDEIWHHARFVLAPGRLLTTFDGLTVADVRSDEIGVAGSVRVEVIGNVQVHKVQLLDHRPTAHFETVPLDFRLNAGTIDGERIARESLPPADRPVTVGGVPFAFPAPDAEGHDHLDIGMSWFAEGAMSGHMSGRGNSVGGRWRGALYLTPSRLAFRVPFARYRALHVIAAADGETPGVPVITAQFYRPQAGFPESVQSEVPAFSATAEDVRILPVTTADGQARHLYHVTIPINPGMLKSLEDLDTLEFELTKQVQLYRAYPDPSYYSEHAYGRDSQVHVYAATLERPRVDLQVKATAYPNVWTAPETPAYAITLTNTTDRPQPVQLIAMTESHDGAEKQRAMANARLNPGQVWEHTLELPVERFGYHTVTFTLRNGDQTWIEHRALAMLRQDTRERGDWAPGKGPFFGYWAWRGGHITPGAEQEAIAMGLAGVDGRTGTYEGASEEERATARRFKMQTLKHFSGADHYRTAALAADLQTMPEEEAVAKFIDAMKAIETKPSDITQLRYVSFYPEPHLGPYTAGNLPQYWNEEPFQLGEAELARVERFRKGLLVGVPVVRKHWPKAQIMMPHGDPLFCYYMLREAPDIAPFVDGIAVDIPCFERLPEMQLHQVAVHRLYQTMDQLRKLGKTDMQFPMYEGPAIPDQPGAVPPRLAADLAVRNALILIGYGVDQLTGAFGAFHAGGYWGEQHYGGGVLERLPMEYPKPMYAAYATLTRHLNRHNYEKWLPTGSLSTYCQQYRHYQDDSLVHAIWMIRGTRPVTVEVPDGATIQVFDQMDNALELTAQNGRVTFPISSSPVFVYGLPDGASITLGETDHSDAKPGDHVRHLTNLASWQVVRESDPTYENNHIHQVRRTLGNLTATAGEAPQKAGGQALAVHLGEQEVERYVMPYYSNLVPPAPVEIPGKASHLGLWVKGASDWGRVIYSLRDANGERWISIGTREQWNCDDVHSWSYFNFDGWRYLTFELPSHAGWDLYREHGTTWWGSHDGDNIVDLPLTLEKIIIERRTHAMYVNDPQPCRPDDVLLGDLQAEYASAADLTDEAIRLSRLREPLPQGTPDLANPIARMTADHELPATRITGITLPEQQADGTRCYVDFTPVEGATSYEIWGAPYADGQGAIRLARNVQTPGQLVRGLRPEMDIWLYVVYQEKEGRNVTQSKPSPGFKIRLKDLFSNK